MEGNTKSSGKGIKGKMVMVCSKYANKAQKAPAPSVTHAYVQPACRHPSPMDAAASNVDERATAYILAVRERFKNEQQKVM